MSEFTKLEAAEQKKREDGTVLPKLSEKEEEARSNDLGRMQRAKEMRDSAHKEFDGMSYLANYETNAAADMAYIPPKLNKQDVRVVTGTTREKDNSLLSALLNYNFEVDITAYDKADLEIAELGGAMQDLVRKSRQIEDYDGKRDLMYRELLAQGDVFVLEQWVQKTRMDRKAEFDWTKGVNFEGYKATATLKLDYERAEATLYPGTKVYKGNIREPSMARQTFCFIAEVLPYTQARSIYQQWARWINVPMRIVKLADQNDDVPYRDWALLSEQVDTVEIIKIFDQDANTFQLYLNGVPMLPVDFPLTEVSPSGKIPVVQGSCERTPFFAYAKGMPAKTKVEQAVIDELFKAAVIKAQQSYNPALINNTGRELSKYLFMPGFITDDVDPTKLVKAFEQNGIAGADLEFLQYMKGIIDAKTTSATFSGEQPNGDVTATQIIEEKKASMMKLGLVVWGVVQFEKQLAEHRIATLLKYWTRPSDGGAFSKAGEKLRTITIDTTLEGGRTGKKVYELNDERAANVHPDQLQIEEELMTLRSGTPTRKVYLSPTALQNFTGVWRVEVTPTEKETSDLHRTQFVKAVSDAAMLFGPESLNMDGLKERYAQLMKESMDTFFVTGPGAGMGIMPGQEVAQSGVDQQVMAQAGQAAQPISPPTQ